MKPIARTAAQKLKAKRGRPKMDVPFREPNGRAARSEDPPDKLALETRARRLGITLIDAKDQKAGSFIGYLYMLGADDGLSTSQYEGACKYVELRRDYLRSIKAADATLHNDTPGGGGGDSVSDQYIEWCKGKVASYDKLRKAVQEAQNVDRAANYWAALDLCIVRDTHIHNMVGDVRSVCNVLARHFGT